MDAAIVAYPTRRLLAPEMSQIVRPPSRPTQRQSPLDTLSLHEKVWQEIGRKRENLLGWLSVKQPPVGGV